MLLKVLFVSLVVAAIALFTFPYWAGCSLKYEVCRTACTIKHFNTDIEAAACKGGCATKKIACISQAILQPSKTDRAADKR